MQNFTLDAFAQAMGSHVQSMRGDGQTSISAISYFSKDVQPGTLFFCKGKAFRKEFLDEALASGTAAYVAERAYREDVPYILVDDMRRVLAPAARLFYDNPQEKLALYGMTGTKGKSSTAWYLRHILNLRQARLGRRPVGFLSSITSYDGEKEWKSALTTPEPFELYQTLSACVSHGVDTVVMEVSSQALKYRRTAGLRFAGAAFLNIAPDHISPIEHPDFADYFQSKLHLFSQTEVAFVNLNTDHLEEVLAAAGQAPRQVYVGSAEDERASYGISEVTEGRHTSFLLHLPVTPSQQTAPSVARDAAAECVIRIPEMGGFAVENAAMGAAMAIEAGALPSEAAEALQPLHIPGRMERAESDDGRIVSFVDFAHNGLSFRAVLETVRRHYTGYEIVAVFGSAGGKGLNRRADMGKVCEELADRVILTMDDPAKEKTEDILQEIAAELHVTPYRIIPDRTEAIRSALDEAAAKPSPEKTVLLFLGKGDETSMHMAEGNVPYEGDQAIVRRWIAEYNSARG